MKLSDLKLNPQCCALLIMDMQNDFISLGGYHNRRGKRCGKMQSIIPTIRYLLDELPTEVKRIYVITVREPDGSDWHWRFHKILPENLISTQEIQSSDRNVLRGTWGAEIVNLLEPRAGDHVFHKRRSSAFYQTDLELCLRNWGIKTLIFTGVSAEICVETSIRDAFCRDFDIIVAGDGVASWNEEACGIMQKVVAQNFGAVLPAKGICELLEYSQSPMPQELGNKNNVDRHAMRT